MELLVEWSLSLSLSLFSCWGILTEKILLQRQGGVYCILSISPLTWWHRCDRCTEWRPRCPRRWWRLARCCWATSHWPPGHWLPSPRGSLWSCCPPSLWGCRTGWPARQVWRWWEGAAPSRGRSDCWGPDTTTSIHSRHQALLLTSSNLLHINVNALKIDSVFPVTVTIRSGQVPSLMLIFAPLWELKTL